MKYQSYNVQLTFTIKETTHCLAKITFGYEALYFRQQGLSSLKKFVT